ncbi:hypothetical protein BN903_88 [Halorubrum sp. AJ67]|nr:hypothetical protein BN903_88 [Halorubrum sp. AJ67]
MSDDYDYSRSRRSWSQSAYQVYSGGSNPWRGSILRPLTYLLIALFSLYVG